MEIKIDTLRKLFDYFMVEKGTRCIEIGHFRNKVYCLTAHNANGYAPFNIPSLSAKVFFEKYKNRDKIKIISADYYLENFEITNEEELETIQRCYKAVKERNEIIRKDFGLDPKASWEKYEMNFGLGKYTIPKDYTKN